MYDYISGEIAELTPALAVIDNHGIGYALNISLTAYNALHTLGSGKVAKLYVYEAIREDAHILYGFIDRTEREMFLLLISVSGVGAASARMILSAMTAETLQQTIATGNAVMLKSVKGIGAKTAQRIIVDLKDKINSASSTLLNTSGASLETFDEALSALVMLGFTQPQARKVLTGLLAEQPGLSVEEAIKQALKLL